MSAPSVAVSASESTTDPAGADSTATAPADDVATASFPTTVTTSAGVEVTTYGAIRFLAYQAQGQVPYTMSVHGVQRVPGGTVVYVSLGYESTEPVTPGGTAELVAPQIGGRFIGGGGLTGVRLTDRGADTESSILLAAGDGVSEPLASDVFALPTESGDLVVMYGVFPELAPATETVDVTLAFGRTIVDVPVGEGLLEPTVPTNTPIPLGTGWPAVSLADIAAAPEPQLSSYPLTRVSQDLEGTTTTTEAIDTITIDVAADVLFAFDSANLDPDAQATLATVGADIVERATDGGTLAIVGHTDSNASNSYNDALSLRRAQAVAALLAPYAGQAGLTVSVDGRGEREPVASNTTEEGRKANRRVSVSFDSNGADQ